jgi:hypothetical protein
VTRGGAMGDPASKAAVNTPTQEREGWRIKR